MTKQRFTRRLVTADGDTRFSYPACLHHYKGTLKFGPLKGDGEHCNEYSKAYNLPGLDNR